MKKESRKDGCPGQSLDGGRGSDIFHMTPEALEAAFQRAVSERDAVYVPEYVTRLDPESGLLLKKYRDGRVEYVLD